MSRTSSAKVRAGVPGKSGYVVRQHTGKNPNAFQSRLATVATADKIRDLMDIDKYQGEYKVGTRINTNPRTRRAI